MPIRPGTDIAFLGGVINYLLSNDKIQHEYVKAYTNASFIVKEDFAFEDGLFTGYDEAGAGVRQGDLDVRARRRTASSRWIRRSRIRAASSSS